MVISFITFGIKFYNPWELRMVHAVVTIVC